MKPHILIALSVLLGLSSQPACADEFVGPFSSWANVKKDYGAMGDGKADDTLAIQKALDDLQIHKKFCVLYFPRGTYRVTKTVKTVRKAHTDAMVTVVGEDPSTTVICWDGPKDGTIFQYDAWNAKISRLTLDGAGKARIALAYGDAFSTFNETSDMVFKDVATGMWMGTAAIGQAENAVLRCKFIRCSDVGLRTNDFNALDIWVWYCLFEDCGFGLLNKAGNFHAYQNLFLRSKQMDISIENLMVFAIVNNTSIGSKCFMDWSSFMNWGSPASITGNRIMEPTGDFAIRLGNGGPYLLMDNVIKTRQGQKGPAVHMTWGDQTFFGNTYTVEQPVGKNGRYRLLDEKIVDPKTIDAAPPRLPGTPPNPRRVVFEVPVGAGFEAIQNALNDAAKLQGQRPVVHLPMGTYLIKQSLTVPAGCDVQITGDGASEIATVLRWVGKAGEPVFRFKGPACATVRDLHMVAGESIGFAVDNCDQVGGAIFADQLNVTGTVGPNKANAGVLVDGMQLSEVLLRNCQGGMNMRSWIKVIGGANPRKDGPATCQVAVFCGATSTSDAPYTVEKGGSLLVRSVYHEMSGDSPQALALSGSGRLAVDSTRFSYNTSADKPLINLDSFNGNFALTTCLLLPVNSSHPATIRFQGRGADCNALCMNNLFWAPADQLTTDAVWKNEAKPPANAALLLCNMNGQVKGVKDSALAKSGFATLEDRGTMDDNGLIRRALAPVRQARIWLPTDSKPGVTNLRFHRVYVRSDKNGIGLELRAIK